MSKPLTAKDWDKAIKTVWEQGKDYPLNTDGMGRIHIPKKLAEEWLKFEREVMEFYDNQPWWRKLIYKWNMWRGKP